MPFVPYAVAGVGVGIIFAGSAMAFMFNIATYYFIMTTSALTSTIGSNGVKILLLIITAITDKISDALTICGIVIVILSIAAYAYFAMDEKKQKQLAAEAAKSDPETATKEAPPTETTPLATPLVGSK